MGRKIRIGIDVGGTFTDAIALDNETYEIVGIKKLHSTHSAPEGVTLGVINVLNELLREIEAEAEDVVFIAHGTTQATNALLEGDVARIGIVGVGKGASAMKSKIDTSLGDIDLGNGKFIRTDHQFIPYNDRLDEAEVTAAIERLKAQGAQGIVSAEAFSVDDPAQEQQINKAAREQGLIGTGSHEISKLYGLKARTKTAVINASILPIMSETAEITSRAVADAHIRAPLMIMRSDGGVMQIDDVRHRPILTVLSGPAAGVAGALMYEKISEGLFLEVGGTSTDISAIQNGKVITRFARIGEHNTYVPSLDINTIGIAGGSMVHIENGKVVTVGPRSAHIAGLNYACFVPEEQLAEGLKLVYVETLPGDPHRYAALKTADGQRYALTLTCTANYLGFVHEGDYAFAPPESVAQVFETLERDMGRPAKEIAEEIMAKALEKVSPAVEDFIAEYNMSREFIVLTGGGGGASAVVPALAKLLGMNHKVAKNSPVISTIGAALAMVRDSVERTIMSPTKEDILRIRMEAEQAVIRAGAAAQTVQVSVEIDSTRNIVRAVALGTTDLSAHKQIGKILTVEEQKATLIERIKDEKAEIKAIYDTGVLNIFSITQKKAGFLPFLSKTSTYLAVMDKQGVVKLNLAKGVFFKLYPTANFSEQLKEIIDDTAKYDEGGQNVPDIYLITEGKIFDMIGMTDAEQAISLAELEVSDLAEDAPVVILINCR